MGRITLIALGVVLGGIAGWAYWHQWGCTSGCTITSSPVNSTLYGALMGGLLLDTFRKAPAHTGNKTENNQNMLRSFFGMAPKVDLPQLLGKGALVLDVRTPSEFARGHADGSMNVPLDQLTQNLHKLPKDKPVVACCQSGGRSAQATSILKDHGFDAHNGGPWTQVQANMK